MYLSTRQHWGRVAKPERRWGCRRGIPIKSATWTINANHKQTEFVKIHYKVTEFSLTLPNSAYPTGQFQPPSGKTGHRTLRNEDETVAVSLFVLFSGGRSGRCEADRVHRSEASPSAAARSPCRPSAADRIELDPRCRPVLRWMRCWTDVDDSTANWRLGSAAPRNEQGVYVNVWTWQTATGDASNTTSTPWKTSAKTCQWHTISLNVTKTPCSFFAV